ncbi:hypothetical protein HPB52_011295 [Rhipicephalus sanguineus]|uniref:Uncharacterized protein n=1 Tax=Rhipicephalus sanguineus TaxID=34632 RepID=A0A9D4Q6C5_RHISA|nr:hypothetical protein HPB52_011295 [Rhipicephalus sanguineus]
MQRETAAGTLPMPPSSSLRESKRTAPSRRSHHGASAPPCDVACCGDGNWNWSADSAADGASAEALIGAIGGHPAGDVEFEQQEAQPKPKGSATYKKDNLQGDFPARRHYEAEGRANEEPDVGPGAAATATVSVQPPVDPTSAAQARANGDMLAEKVRQLQTTRSQLQYLQSLVASFQDGNTESAASAQRSGVSSSGESDLRKEQQKQRHNLEQLQEQRLRLSLLRQQLASGQAPLAKNQLRVAPEGPPHHLPATSPRGPSADPALSPTKKDNENSSNLESLSRDKAILEELLQQERSKQLLSYSHNEDVRSPSSCSASSEPMEGMNFGTGSVMAGGNTTIAATWGGSSTQENLEDDEDDDEDRQEGSVEAGHDSEGSRSDVENDTGRSMPPPLAGKDHHHVSAEPAALPTKRADNRLTNTHAVRASSDVCEDIH